jgi:hypothetical protein
MDRLKKFANDKAEALQSAADRASLFKTQLVAATSENIDSINESDKNRLMRDFHLNRSQSLENPRDAQPAPARDRELCPLCLELIALEWAERHFAECRSEFSSLIGAPQVDVNSGEIDSVLRAIDADTSEDLTNLEAKIKFLSKQSILWCYCCYFCL